MTIKVYERKQVMKQPVIAIIGAGAVGSTVAYALILHDIAAHIVIVDVNNNKCKGEVGDLEDSLSMSKTSKICSGTLHDAAQADIIVIAAGIAQKPGQTRRELLSTNYDIVGSIIQSMKPINSTSVIIVVTNPVDILTRYVQEIAGLPKNQIFGSGTFLDTHRLRGLLGEYLSINPRSIHAYVLGEHGESQFVPWSTVTIGTVPLSFFSIPSETLDAMAQKAQNKVYEIIACKGFTSFGVASSVATYCENIIDDAKRIVPVSCFVEDLGVCLSMPAVLGLRGIEQILCPPLNEQEQEKLAICVKILDEQYANLSD